MLTPKILQRFSMLLTAMIFQLQSCNAQTDTIQFYVVATPPYTIGGHTDDALCLLYGDSDLNIFITGSSLQYKDGVSFNFAQGSVPSTIHLTVIPVPATFTCTAIPDVYTTGLGVPQDVLNIPLAIQTLSNDAILSDHIFVLHQQTAGSFDIQHMEAFPDAVTAGLPETAMTVAFQTFPSFNFVACSFGVSPSQNGVDNFVSTGQTSVRFMWDSCELSPRISMTLTATCTNTLTFIPHIANTLTEALPFSTDPNIGCEGSHEAYVLIGDASESYNLLTIDFLSQYRNSNSFALHGKSISRHSVLPVPHYFPIDTLSLANIHDLESPSSSAPTMSPSTDVPTTCPSESPSSSPTAQPSMTPTSGPTSIPTEALQKLIFVRYDSTYSNTNRKSFIFTVFITLIFTVFITIVRISYNFTNCFTGALTLVIIKLLDISTGTPTTVGPTVFLVTPESSGSANGSSSGASMGRGIAIGVGITVFVIIFALCTCWIFRNYFSSNNRDSIEVSHVDVAGARYVNDSVAIGVPVDSTGELKRNSSE
eukprot:jgi/Bigna1/80206/fgenesh1_pg.68_\